MQQLQRIAGIILLSLYSAFAYANLDSDIPKNESDVPGTMTTGERKQVGIRVYNKGTDVWTQAQNHRLGSGSGNYGTRVNQFTWSNFPPGSYTNVPTNARVLIPSGASVYQNQYVDFYFDITAPSSPGTYKLAVRMVWEGVTWFGEDEHWDITVNVGTGIPLDRWRAEIWDNKYLSGNPKVTRTTDPTPKGFVYILGGGSPDPAIPIDNFSVRFMRNAYFDSGNYTFTVNADDGVRVWVDGIQIIEGWIDQSSTEYTGAIYLSAGQHTVRMDYYEHTGAASATMDWNKNRSRASSIGLLESISPVPANQHLTVQLNQKQPAKIEIHNLQGEMVLREETAAITKEHKVDVSPLKAGVYLLVITTEKSVETHRIVIE